MSIDPNNDLTLARRVAAGDEAALEALYARYADPLFAFIYHRMGDSRSEAEEVWQETLLAAFQSLGAYRGQSRLFTWLCGIARHKLADHYRHRGRKPAESLAVALAQEWDLLVDTAPLPEELLAQRATRARVVEALGALPADYRAALVARYADEHSVDQVARLLGKTYKATESLLARARAAFRAALAGAEEKRDE